MAQKIITEREPAFNQSSQSAADFQLSELISSIESSNLLLAQASAMTTIAL